MKRLTWIASINFHQWIICIGHLYTKNHLLVLLQKYDDTTKKKKRNIGQVGVSIWDLYSILSLGDRLITKYVVLNSSRVYFKCITVHKISDMIIGNIVSSVPVEELIIIWGQKLQKLCFKICLPTLLKLQQIYIKCHYLQTLK